ncbi:MAG TPA: transcription elongation factor GreA, partial [Alcanivorax sp.]|nr:transcription elongation factor GreA [Alcanivorax sp.]
VTVTIVDVDSDEEKVYQIVGDDEADIKSGKLSVNSPIARGLIGREEGDTVQIDTPGGTKEYEVDKVEHL